MMQLGDWYRQGLNARIEALESARNLPEEKRTEGIQSIRRIAHSLRGSGALYGFVEISDAAADLLNADQDNFFPALDKLTEVLRQVISEGDTAKTGILLIDDDRDVTRILEIKLSAPTREIYVAEDTAEAKAILEECDVSLILLDLILPDSDGRNFLIRLRERPRTAAIPVFIVSGEMGAQPKTECLALGADEYFTKPFDLDVLSAAVSRRLQRTLKMAHESRLDELTQVPNRAAFCEAFAQAEAHISRNNESLALTIFDLDRFKIVNDTYGHMMGDEVLRRTAQLVHNALRKSDVFARWGGEEFVVLFPHTDAAHAVIAMNKILELLRDETFVSEQGESFHITFSAGVVNVTPGVSVEDAINEADRYLYLAKERGRNRVLSALDEVSQTKTAILLIEDDRTIAAIVLDRLKLEGIHTLHARNGQEGLSMVDNCDISLIILDIVMPVMDGFEFLERLSKIPNRKKVPILILTAMGSKEDIVRGFKLGADDYMLKPFAPSELVSRIRHLTR